MATDYRQAKAVFLEAIHNVPADGWDSYIDRACADDVDLRSHVLGLLQEHAAAGQLATHAIQSVAARVAPAIAEAPGTIIGLYKLLEQIGEGGMGAVYVAEQKEPVRRTVALKVIKPGMDTRQVVARFEAERQALAMMNHPNIAKVLDAGATEAGRPYFVMELVKGSPITEFCDQQKLDTRERLQLFITLCQAVQHAHQKGLIHRDLKPSNVLVEMHDVRAVPKVIDFGVAKAIGQQLTDKTLHTGFSQMVGTPLYMSPEQAGQSSIDVDTRSDVYSLGVLLYEILTGHTPFENETLRQAGFDEMRRMIREVDPPRPSARVSTLQAKALSTISDRRKVEPSKLSGQLRGELDWIVMKALEKDRNRRYESASALARDVQRYLADEPVEARPPSTGYRLSKFLRRNKAPVIAAGLVSAALLIGIVGTTLGMFRATRAEAVAEQRLKDAEAERAKAAASAVAEAGARKKAEKAENDTLASYRASTDDAIEQLIASKEQLGPQEKAYLEKTLQRWQAFAARQGADERSQAIRGEGHVRVATLWSKLGRFEEARAEYQVARDILKKLVEQFPAVSEYRLKLAQTHLNLGNQVASLGKWEDSRAELRSAGNLLKKLVEQFPGVPAHQLDLASMHHNLGNRLAELGRREDAQAEYQAALELKKKLVEQFPGEPAYRQSLATSHTMLGSLLDNLGKREEARSEYQAAGNLQKKLVARFPAIPVYQQDLARTHYNLAILLAGHGKDEDAQAEYQAAYDLRKNLIEQFPAVPAYQEELASTHIAMGNLYQGLGKGDKARVEFQAAGNLQEKLVEQFPTVPSYQRSLAGTHYNLGNLLADLGKVKEARTEYQVARVLQEKLVEQFPAVPSYQIDLGGSYCNHGNSILENGDPDESLEWYDLAVRTLQLVHDQVPRDLRARQFLRNSHFMRGQAYDRLQQHAEAIKDKTRAIELSPSAEQPKLSASRAISQIHAGMVAEAIAEVAELAKNPKSIADDWYHFACFYAVASGKIADKKQEYADRAMELLTKAVEAGWKNAAHMAKDTDLDPLRDRDDFRKLYDRLSQQASIE